MSRTLVRVLFAVLLVLTLLGPLAQLLRTQNPWNCFQLTADESLFTQAIHNWSIGQGFRLPGDVKPFEPVITIGLPMAWGTAKMAKLTHSDLAHGGRLFVHLCFYLLLGVLGWGAFRISRSWATPVLTLGIFGYLLSDVAHGPYITYGVLGEIPGALLGWISLFLLNGQWLGLAGFFLAACFIVKPTYLLLVPAVLIVSVSFFGKKGLRTWFVAAVTVIAAFAWMASQRNESVFAYVRSFLSFGANLSKQNSDLRLWDYYSTARPVVWVTSVLIVLAGLFGLAKKMLPIRFKSSMTPAEVAAWLCFLIAILYYLVLGVRPLDKHWAVFYGMGAAMLAIRIGVALGPWITEILGQEIVCAVFVAVLATWMINVPGFVRKSFLGAPENACPVKEQRYLDHYLTDLAAKGELRPEQLGAVTEFSSSLFLYELGWNVVYHPKWSSLGTPRPEWVVGDLPTVLPAPAGCELSWKGSQYGLFRCK